MNKKTLYFALFLSLVAGLAVYRFSPIQNQKNLPSASVFIGQALSGEPAPQPAPRPAPSPAPRKTTPLRPAAPPSAPAEEHPSFLLDSDNDGFSDRIELALETDPTDEHSYPKDENRNGIDDAWEQKFGIVPNDGEEDSDKDGLSDKLEYRYGTDPLKPDSDNDTFGDSDEILQFGTDPNDATDPGTIENIGIRITNFDKNQSVSDSQPFVKGVAPKDSVVEIVVALEDGEDRVLGRTTTQENDVFIFLIPEILEDGEYDLVARVIEPAGEETFLGMPVARAQDTGTGDTAGERSVILMESDPVHITVNRGLEVIPPTPQKLSDREVTEENLLQDLRIEIIDNQPVLLGKAAYNSEVVATWRSIVLASALISDSPRGEFSISAFHPLGSGDHEVYVQAVRLRDNAVSKTIKVPFTIVEQEPQKEETEPAERQQTMEEKELRPASAEVSAGTSAEATSPLDDLLSGKYALYFWPVAAVALFAVIGNIAALVRLRKKTPKNPADQNPKDTPKPPPSSTI